MGDDGHNRNRAANLPVLREPSVARCWRVKDRWPNEPRRLRFIESNDHFMLNLVMAAAKLSVDAASDVKDSSLVTTMTRNGTEFGIRLAGTGRRWFTAAAPVVDGLYLGSYHAADANPDIGDSAITETVGLGGFADGGLARHRRIRGRHGGGCGPEDAGDVRDHPGGASNSSESRSSRFAGTPIGIDAALVARTGVAPQINTGIAGNDAGVGMVGAGLVKAPMACFVTAVNALAATTGASAGAVRP